MKLSVIIIAMLFLFTVHGEPAFAGSPGEWTVNPADFEYFMTVTAELNINQLKSNEPGNVIAAFSGDECRGVAQTTDVNGDRLFFLMIYSNTASESISLRCYLSLSDLVVNSSNSFAFESGSPLGSITEPYVVNAIDSTLLSIESRPVPLNSFELLNNYPNPFNGVTQIQYTLSRTGFISLSVYDVQGNLVNELVHGNQPAGRQIVQWDGRDQRGQEVSSGVYIYRLSNNSQIFSKKMTLLK